MRVEFKESYETTSGIAILVSAIGWIILIGGGYIVFFSEFSNSMRTDVKLYGTAVTLFFGFLFIVTGQMMRAIIDNTNANREILHILKSRKETDLTG